jgi:FlaA1/EpsC-like NDP-sugar epimerase
MTRYFMSIPEAVNLIIHAACMTTGNQIFVLKMGEVVRILDLAERMIRLRGLRPYKDIEIRFSGVRPGEKMHEALFYDEENPAETLHPNIVELHNWPDNFDSARFFNQLVRIMAQSDPLPGDNFLEILMELIEPEAVDQHPPILSDDKLHDGIATGQ